MVTAFAQSFVGLTQLENLELDVGPILLQAHSFDSLPSLKFFKIKVIETFQYLSQVLAPLSNLKTIEIVGNRSVGICQNKFSSKIPHSLTDIRYTNSPLTELQANSMTCIPQLEKFTITNTQLSTIQAGAFKSMDNLKYMISDNASRLKKSYSCDWSEYGYFELCKKQNKTLN
ncbi:leucine-rich repeat neuronal protein 1-like [Aphidius gifuensis]|uniref:leucine-rich repeat neuronal protein 1-like n=1 Tax=Aphidius gifuensis TaxID=684658 RepID=UPI001CDBACB0|nr:leucine-rich repeat neuronal protein 1-like [Aphidius gifuensis]